MLILYLQGQKQNLSTRISKLKKPWTDLNFMVVQYIFHPDQLHSRCHFPNEVAEYFSKQLNNVKGKYNKHREGEFYTVN